MFMSIPIAENFELARVVFDMAGKDRYLDTNLPTPRQIGSVAAQNIVFIGVPDSLPTELWPYERSSITVGYWGKPSSNHPVRRIVVPPEGDILACEEPDSPELVPITPQQAKDLQEDLGLLASAM
jgi:hypothetical protein